MAQASDIKAEKAAQMDRPMDRLWAENDDLRAASDPDAMLTDFLRSTYEAAADLGKWDREQIEREPLAP